jgi:hypothetical protein
MPDNFLPTSYQEFIHLSRYSRWLPEKERRETELQKAAVVAMGFAEDKDVNDNQIPDVLELAREGLDADIKLRKQNLDEKKFEHDKETDKEKLKIENKKANQIKQKAN